MSDFLFRLSVYGRARGKLLRTNKQPGKGEPWLRAGSMDDARAEELQGNEDPEHPEDRGVCGLRLRRSFQEETHIRSWLQKVCGRCRERGPQEGGKADPT